MYKTAIVSLPKPKKGNNYVWEIGRTILENYCKRYQIDCDELINSLSNNNLRLRARVNDDNFPSYPSLCLEVCWEDLEVCYIGEYQVNTKNLGDKFLVKRIEFKSPNGYGKELSPSGIEKTISPYAKILEKVNTPAKFLKRLSKAWVNPLGILRRLRNEPVTLFQPWGYTYSEQVGVNQKSVDALEKDALIILILQCLDIDTNFLLMPADIYASRINGWSKRLVMKYSSNLGKIARKVVQRTSKDANLEVKPWSQIIKENSEKYYSIKEAVLRDKDEREFYFEDALLAAKRYANRSTYARCAEEYVVERLTEARLIDWLYRPIKISLSSVSKDNIDGQLPRMYLRGVKPFPWLGD